MRTRSIRKRLARLEKLTGPKYDEDGNELNSLEEACRRWWKLDKKRFMKFAENKTYQLFIRRFQAVEFPPTLTRSLDKLVATNQCSQGVTILDLRDIVGQFFQEAAKEIQLCKSEELRRRTAAGAVNSRAAQRPKNRKSGCTRSSVSPTTAWRIMKTPEFKEKYRVARKQRYSQSMARLQESSPVAVAILKEIMMDRTAPAPSRVRAATVALAFAAKSLDLEDIEARLSQLEEAAKETLD